MMPTSLRHSYPDADGSTATVSRSTTTTSRPTWRPPPSRVRGTCRLQNLRPAHRTRCTPPPRRPGPPPITAPPVESLAELLADHDTPISYRVGDVAPENARIIVSAQYKAAKLPWWQPDRSLVDGDPFLGAFTVHTPARRIVLIDNEMSENTLRRWLRDQAITNTAAVADVLALRGKVAAFNLLDDRRRYQWATRLADLGCDYLILDCLRPCLDALGLDEGREAGQFLTAYDALLDEAAITNTAIVQHMGHRRTIPRRLTHPRLARRHLAACTRNRRTRLAALLHRLRPRRRHRRRTTRIRPHHTATHLLEGITRRRQDRSRQTRRDRSPRRSRRTAKHERHRSASPASAPKTIRARAAAAVHDGLVTVAAGPRRARLRGIACPCSESECRRRPHTAPRVLFIRDPRTVRMTPSASVRCNVCQCVNALIPIFV